MPTRERLLMGTGRLCHDCRNRLPKGSLMKRCPECHRANRRDVERRRRERMMLEHHMRNVTVWAKHADYEAFREIAWARGCSISAVVQDAMAQYLDREEET